ncbi:cobalamin B12-binding domain-containing protein [Candidatus Magnetominusculus xianensis]|uniref:Cobalamin-binding protein n=1 Tax=Candidatus Magnetominusculus xianensis TaxID=1748249 RepID=A0ABR5SHK7_9BACT|nr:cobalamin-dependent protein [Candidatus Magnetominusculus xianensis]KWT82915.1 cobalamin-binding protein [Candidatus Magnetominusculus xianensis]MBF0405317.1 cobalamin-dependent protein [Nitrospirota bacterium]
MENQLPVDDAAIYIKNMIQSLLSVNKIRAKMTLMEASTAYQPIEVVEKVIVPSLEQIGEGWTMDKVSLSQVYMSGKICTEILHDIMPQNHTIRKKQLRIAIATLEDFHTLGKQIVKSFLHSSGYEVVDYGNGRSAGDLVSLTIKDKIEVLLISVLMLPSALKVKEVRRKMRENQAAITIVVGGAPFNFDDKLYEEVEADYAGRTVSDAINIIRSIENSRGL